MIQIAVSEVNINHSLTNHKQALILKNTFFLSELSNAVLGFFKFCTGISAGAFIFHSKLSGI